MKFYSRDEDVTPLQQRRREENAANEILLNPPKWMEGGVDFAVISALERRQSDSPPARGIEAPYQRGHLQRILSNPATTLTVEESPWLDAPVRPAQLWWEALLQRRPSELPLQVPDLPEPSEQSILQVQDLWRTAPTDVKYLEAPTPETAPWVHFMLVLEPFFWKDYYVGSRLVLVNGPPDTLTYLSGMSPFHLAQAPSDFFLNCVHQATCLVNRIPPHPIVLRPAGTLHHQVFSGFNLGVGKEGNFAASMPLHRAITRELDAQIGTWSSMRRLRTLLKTYADQYGYKVFVPPYDRPTEPMRTLNLLDPDYAIGAILASQGYTLDKALLYGAYANAIRKDLIKDVSLPGVTLVNLSSLT